MKKVVLSLIFVLGIVAIFSATSVQAHFDGSNEVVPMWDDSDWAQPEPGDEYQPSLPGVIIAEFDYRRLDSFYTSKYWAGWLRDQLVIKGVEHLPYVGDAISKVARVSLRVVRMKSDRYWTSFLRDLENGTYRAVRIRYEYDTYLGYRIVDVYGVR